jgi:hypothetical protein
VRKHPGGWCRPDASAQIKELAREAHGDFHVQTGGVDVAKEWGGGRPPASRDPCSVSDDEISGRRGALRQGGRGLLIVLKIEGLTPAKPSTSEAIQACIAYAADLAREEVVGLPA